MVLTWILILCFLSPVAATTVSGTKFCDMDHNRVFTEKLDVVLPFSNVSILINLPHVQPKMAVTDRKGQFRLTIPKLPEYVDITGWAKNVLFPWPSVSMGNNTKVTLDIPIKC